jgi:hypothetical protein
MPGGAVLAVGAWGGGGSPRARASSTTTLRPARGAPGGGMPAHAAAAAAAACARALCDPLLLGRPQEAADGGAGPQSARDSPHRGCGPRPGGRRRGWGRMQRRLAGDGWWRRGGGRRDPVGQTTAYGVGPCRRRDTAAAAAELCEQGREGRLSRSWRRRRRRRAHAALRAREALCGC